MRLLPAAAFALVVVTAPLASAQNVLIDFENNWSYGTDVNGYYAGGTASDSTSGPNRGVSFVNFTGLSNDASSRTTATRRRRSASPTPMPRRAATTPFINMTTAAAGALTFSYSSPVGIAGAVRAFSGPNGTGNLLASIDLNGNAPTGDYATWTQATLQFAVLARSFDFVPGTNDAAFDNVAITAADLCSRWN